MVNGEVSRVTYAECWILFDGQAWLTKLCPIRGPAITISFRLMGFRYDEGHGSGSF